jgi:hypothetical protein
VEAAVATARCQANNVISEFETFLRGTHTSERIGSSELRKAISVDTGLERPIADALAVGRDVVITGSAGGGKTQFVERVMELLANRPKVPAPASPGEANGAPHVLVIRDLTAVHPDNRAATLRGQKGTTARLIAANEGTLGSVVQPPFDRVLDTLHEMQQGKAPTEDHLPVVVDLGGFNPFEAAFAEIVGLPLIAEVVNQLDCCVSPITCPRRRAWKQLLSLEVRQKLAQVLTVSQGPREVLLRDVWDFVADLAIGGDCQQNPPTSTWFWRVFFGESEISLRLLENIRPELIAMPRDDIRLYYGDWQNLEAEPFDGVKLQWLPSRPAQANEPLNRRSMMNWLKLQMALVTKPPRESGQWLVSGSESDAVLEVGQERPDLLVAGLNRYHRYNLEAKIPEQVLELWVDLGIERRQHRPLGMFSLGSIPRASVRISRSEIVGNLAGVQMKGLRAYLRGSSDKGALRLDHRLLAALLRGRPVRLADRQHEDVDWAIWRFYIDLAGTQQPGRLEILRFGNNFGHVTHAAWKIESGTNRIEPAI